MPLRAISSWCTGADSVAFGLGLTSTVDESPPTTTTSASARNCAAATPMPGAPPMYLALSFIHSEPQPVCVTTTSPGVSWTFCRDSAAFRSATVIS
jgi:hypothetical protein